MNAAGPPGFRGSGPPRNRTGTLRRAADVESAASANSARGPPPAAIASRGRADHRLEVWMRRLYDPSLGRIGTAGKTSAAGPTRRGTGCQSFRRLVVWWTDGTA